MQYLRSSDENVMCEKGAKKEKKHKRNRRTETV
jgi:hypothetical protein